MTNGDGENDGDSRQDAIDDLPTPRPISKDAARVADDVDSSPIARVKIDGKKAKPKKRFIFEDSSSSEDDEDATRHQSVAKTYETLTPRDADDRNNNSIMEKPSEAPEDKAAKDKAAKDKPVQSQDSANVAANSSKAPIIETTPVKTDSSSANSSQSTPEKDSKEATAQASSPQPQATSQNLDPIPQEQGDLVRVQKEIEEQLRRAKEQEEEDRKMALRLQRLFQKEQHDELTKRPDGYGTRSASSSRSPRPKTPSASPPATSAKEESPSKTTARQKTFSKAIAGSFSRSRSLTTIDKNASSSLDRDFGDGDNPRASPASSVCPHRTTQGSENCSFCILTSPKGGGRGVGSSLAASLTSSPSSSQGSNGGKGKGGKGLKRKTSSGSAATSSNKSKKRKDTV